MAIVLLHFVNVLMCNRFSKETFNLFQMELPIKKTHNVYLVAGTAKVSIQQGFE